jgi:hypothetical protein
VGARRGATGPSHAHAVQSLPTEPGTKRCSSTSVSPPRKWAPDVTWLLIPQSPPDHAGGCRDPPTPPSLPGFLRNPRVPALGEELRAAAGDSRWRGRGLPPPAASFVPISQQRSGQRAPARGRGPPEQTLPRSRAPARAAPPPPQRPWPRAQRPPRALTPSGAAPSPSANPRPPHRPARPARLGSARLTMARPAARPDSPAAALPARLRPPARPPASPVPPPRTVGTQKPSSAAGGAPQAPPRPGAGPDGETNRRPRWDGGAGRDGEESRAIGAQAARRGGG